MSLLTSTSYVYNSVNFGVASELQNIELKAEIAMLKMQVGAQLQELNELRSFRSGISVVLTQNQIRKLQTQSKKKSHWMYEDIAWAIPLHAAGPRAYNHLLRKGFPLPSASTLSRWLQRLKFNDGVLKFVISEMRLASPSMELADRLCVIVFDEMSVARSYEHNPLTDTVKKPSKNVQMVIARGLKKSWKQPVFYAFDCKMTRSILEGIISQLENAGYPVVATVCDMGGANRALWTELEVSTEKTWFANPSDDGGKVFVFADAPHLLKLLRDHFLNPGYILQNKHISAETVEELMEYTSMSDLSITYKVKDHHLDVQRHNKQKVKLAAQLLSHSTASAIRRCYEMGSHLTNPIETADFIEVIDNWFDLLNSKLGSPQCNPARKPYGLDLVQQNAILDAMNWLILNIRARFRYSLLPCQKGVLITNASLKGLFEYVQERYGMRYILTYRLNQDVLENFFGAMRAKGGLHDKPSAMQFKYRLRKYLLARNTELLRGNGNVELDETEWLGLQNIPSSTTREYLMEEDSSIAPIDLEELDDDIDQYHEDAVEYLAGYIIKKLRLSGLRSQDSTNTYVDQLSRGVLIKPSADFVEKLKLLEKIFNEVNGVKIYSGRGFMATMLRKSELVDLSDDIKKKFFTCRMHFRIKFLNTKK